MRQSEAISSLFKERILLPPESISNSLLGYLFFREKILETILGDSEINILYWVGKEIGNSLEVKLIEEVEDIFLQLDLGQVQIEAQSACTIDFKITHNRFNLIPKKRLEKTLNLEAGLLAGIMEKITETYCAAQLQINEKEGIYIGIEVVMDKSWNNHLVSHGV
ncbi:MAG TPA: DUF2507 domain-containing protein [Bacillota bacterium]|nr:DUF2507 domain-containing protein [Bacillota bacterium]